MSFLNFQIQNSAVTTHRYELKISPFLLICRNEKMWKIRVWPNQSHKLFVKTCIVSILIISICVGLVRQTDKTLLIQMWQSQCCHLPFKDHRIFAFNTFPGVPTCFHYKPVVEKTCQMQNSKSTMKET
jgi:hypothetical protein